MTAQHPDPLGTGQSSSYAPGSSHPTDLRSRAAVALVLGVVGALGLGSLSTGLTSLVWALEASWLDDPLAQWGLVGGLTVVFGAAALVLATEPGRSGDPVAVPVARAAQVAAVIAVAAGVLTLLGALLQV